MIVSSRTLCSSFPQESASPLPGRSPQAPLSKILLPQTILSVVGFFVSLYALVGHIKGKTTGESLSCDINDLVSCSKVFTSEYGEFLGIPLGALGMTFFAVILATSILPKFAIVSKKTLAIWMFFPSFVGAVVSVFLAYISYFVLKVVCPVCTGIHIISLLIFLVSLFDWIKTKNAAADADNAPFLKWVSLVLTLSVPPLLAGVLAPAIAPSFLGKTKEQDSAAATDSLSKAKKAPEDVLVVSKSNYVGKGEDYRKGPDNAKVVLFMYSDFQCPHCKKVASAIDEAISMVGNNSILFVYRNYPLSNHCNASMGSEGHKFSCELANATRCAGQQGKFWEYKAWVFENLEEGLKENTTFFGTENLVQYASKIGLSAEQFKQCYESKVELEKIKEDISFGQKLDIKGTPLLVLGGKVYDGPVSSAAIASALTYELNSAP